ncbi:hypothetical protein BU24DRAFT_471504, partial [Aaosphaeria arxii CBS 175.79]
SNPSNNNTGPSHQDPPCELSSPPTASYQKPNPSRQLSTSFIHKKMALRRLLPNFSRQNLNKTPTVLDHRRHSAIQGTVTTKWTPRPSRLNPLVGPSPQICTSLIDGPFLVPGCDLYGVPYAQQNSTTGDDDGKQRPLTAAITPRYDAPNPRASSMNLITATATEETTAVLAATPWPYRLPLGLRPVPGTRFAQQFGSQDKVRLGTVERELRKVAWWQYVLYGVPEEKSTIAEARDVSEGEVVLTGTVESEAIEVKKMEK